MQTANKIIVLLILTWLTPRIVSGQEERAFDEMWELTAENNPDLQNARLQVDRLGKMKSSSWDLGMTSVDLNRGQINSALIDNQWTIEQQIGSPFEMAATSKYYQSEIGLFNGHYEKIRRSVKRSLRKYYYEWLYENQRQKIAERALSLFENASHYATLQYETGETNLLSKALIDSRMQEISLAASRIQVTKDNLVNQINVIVNYEEKILPESRELTKLPVPDPEQPVSGIVDSIPDVSVERQRMQVARSYLGLTRSRISPYFKAGYFNQQLDQVSGFDGWLVGIAFPLWFLPQKARIQAASIDMSIAENNYWYQKSRMEIEYRNIMNRFNQLEENLSFYEQKRIDNARMIEDNANLLYESGEIGYLEYVQNLNTAIQIQEDYWRLVNEYNLLVIDLYYYLDI